MKGNRQGRLSSALCNEQKADYEEAAMIIGNKVSKAELLNQLNEI